MRGLTSRKESLISDLGFDLVLIQETLLSCEESINASISRWPGPSFWSPALGKQGGVAILIKENFEANVISWLKDSRGRVLSLLLQIGSTRVNIINIYAPTDLTERKSFFEKLHDFFIPADNRIIGGDFNCYDNELDKFGGNVSLAKYLSDFRSTFSFVDIWRKRHPRSREMSWFNADLSIGSRLDKFFISAGLVGLVEKCEILPCCVSDHDFVSLSFDFKDLAPRGPGVWKMNNSLLEDDNFCQSISARILDLASCKDSFDSVKSWWDFLKSSLKDDIIFLAREKRRSLSHERISLANRLIGLRRQLIQGDSSISDEIIFVESQLAALVDRAADGAKTRSRVQWLEEGEKPSRYFFKLEKERFERNQVSSILNSEGVEVFDRHEIEKAHVDFYSKLFSVEDIDTSCRERLLQEISTSLSDSDSALCEGLISIEELTASLKTQNSGKAPGPDGFTAEFYVKFWNLLGPLLLDVINQSYADGELPESMKTSMTRLIFKKRGDVKDLKNWRPISLLNVDYKICSKAITLRLSKVLHVIVDPDQTCSVPGRSISSNIIQLRDTLDYIEQTGETGILVSLDQEKAFDRVNRDFLMNLLRRFGFGPNFCMWIATFYAGAHMQILLNGWLTDPIPLNRGVRQGDSLSPLLYILCVEVLACLVRNCDDIRGFLLPGAGGKQFKVRQYADDTTSFVKDYFSLVSLFKLITIYEKGSGAKLNRSKSEAMWLGAWQSRTDEPLGLTWVRKMKILGVFFGTVPVETDNWQPKINKLEKSLNLWKSRSLSFIGKCLIINVLGLSKFLYLAKVLLLPAWVLHRVNQLIWPFLWGSKIETVSRNTCYLPVRSGGLNISNLELKSVALRLSSVSYTLSLPEDSSFFLCKYFVGGSLAPLRPEWRSLRDNSSPSAAQPTPFYMKSLNLFSKLGNLLSANVPLSTKCIYKYLLKENSSPPILPYPWLAILGPGLIMSDHWARVRDPLTENFKNDLLWSITLRGVKVRDSLKNWGYIASDRCATCGRKETIDHCFLNCSRAKRVWQYFAPCLSLLIESPFTANVVTAFFFRWSSHHRKKNAVAHFVIKTILYGLWTFRNKATFHNGTESHKAIIKYALFDISNRIKLDFFRLPLTRFKSLWTIPGFCTLQDNDLRVSVAFSGL